jgi:hypothetical protein
VIVSSASRSANWVKVPASSSAGKEDEDIGGSCRGVGR